MHQQQGQMGASYNQGQFYSTGEFPGGAGQQQQQPMQQQQQQPQGFGGLDSLGGVASLAENPILQSYAKDNIRVMQEQLAGKYLPGATSFWNKLHHYFHVDNKYVLKKSQLLIFPWRHKEWGRIRVGDETGKAQLAVNDFAPPVADTNAPDMYLPMMAIVTYILVIGFLKGTKGVFNPEVLQDTFSTSGLVLLLEVLLMKGGLYTLGGQTVRLVMLDLVVFSAYKYVLIAFNLFIGIFLGSAVYNATLLYSCLCMSYFIYKTMEQAVPRPIHEASGHKRRLYYLVACAALQFLTIAFLGYTRDLGETSFWTGASAVAQAGGAAVDAGEADNEADV
eukprot:CAMPEP_0203775154 /NCGR_PEP_ID=MMETSP0099_2-20121227/5869_1 /ASSEMBLY_ACC=CAM_ASM_000209 /TAXON_ID=96639 /ORGANISM=" , Strain NY0313808BC1" /LENGTH=334 /DNA_ID=CAMNT_0050673691 /DNA_START=241 /DNA_END=1245 /DNA_ORIENTATION=+